MDLRFFEDVLKQSNLFAHLQIACNRGWVHILPFTNPDFRAYLTKTFLGCRDFNPLRYFRERQVWANKLFLIRVSQASNIAYPNVGINLKMHLALCRK